MELPSLQSFGVRKLLNHFFESLGGANQHPGKQTALIFSSMFMHRQLELEVWLWTPSRQRRNMLLILLQVK